MNRAAVILFLIAAIIVSVGTSTSFGLIREAEMMDAQAFLTKIRNEFLARALFNPTHNNPQPPTHPIQSIKVMFDFAVQPVDPDHIADTKDEYFVNAVSQCSFHSPTDISTKTCFVCKLRNEDNHVVGTGRVDLPKGYKASTTVPIPITDLDFVGSNDVTNVKNVKVEICQSNSGCSPGFWKNHPEQWKITGFSPYQKFKQAFELGPNDIIKIKIGQKTITDPTLGEALRATGGGLVALVRQSVAALLNSASNIDYPLTTSQVKAEFKTAFTSGNYEQTKNSFEYFNTLGCPFDGKHYDEKDDKKGDDKKGDDKKGDDKKGGK